MSIFPILAATNCSQPVRCRSIPMYSDDNFSDADVAYQLAHITETKAPTIIAAIAALVVLATIAIGLRFFVRWHIKSGFQADDYTIFGAWVYISHDEMA